MSVWEFCALASPPAFDVAARTTLLADLLLLGRKHGLTENAVPRRTPFGWQHGVCGVGARLSDVAVPAAVLVPAVFVVTKAPSEVSPLPGETSLSRVVTDLLGGVPDWLTTVQVVGVTPPEPQIGPGDGVNSPNPGTVGCNVRWGGKSGFLTAGHVVRQTGVPVFVAGTQVGTSAYCNDPTNHGTRIEDDVAVVEVTSGPLMMRFAGSAHGAPNAPVSVVVVGAAPNTNLRSYSAWTFSPALNATWGNLYQTTVPVTQPGHSGAPVQDANAAVIGHVVGVMPGVGTLIQDIHYQLAAIGSLAAPAVATATQTSLAGIRI
jgi:hypothetical protein